MDTTLIAAGEMSRSEGVWPPEWRGLHIAVGERAARDLADATRRLTCLQGACPATPGCVSTCRFPHSIVNGKVVSTGPCDELVQLMRLIESGSGALSVKVLTCP